MSEVQRSWATSAPDSPINCRLSFQGCTLAELLARLAEIAPDVSSRDIVVHQAFVKWVDEPTPEERERRDAFERARRERHEQWERETFRRLRARFEVDPAFRLSIEGSGEDPQT